MFFLPFFTRIVPFQLDKELVLQLCKVLERVFPQDMVHVFQLDKVQVLSLQQSKFFQHVHDDGVHDDVHPIHDQWMDQNYCHCMNVHIHHDHDDH